jgi:phosphatidylserine/phosphatidylglycerophosphate/cardiolipin synthase-like enzyme
MNTFRNHKRSFFKLQTNLSLLIVILLQAILYFFLFSPSVVVIHEEKTDPVFFSTDLCDPIRPSLAHSICQAKESVLLLTYSLSDPKIIGALRTAAKTGAKVTVIYDAKAASETPNLLGKRITCYPRKSRGLMHHKLVVIDHKISWIGSTNMTTTSFLQHGNMTLALSSQALASHIEQYASSLIHNTAPSSSLIIDTPQQKLFFYIHPEAGKQSLASLISRIDSATHRVFVAMYTFTHKALYDALCRAKQRGVDVRVIFDKDSLRQTSQVAFAACRKAKIPCRYRTRPGLFHYKVAIIDNSIVTGSCNWTKAGFAHNDDCICIFDPLTKEQLIWVQRWWDSVEQQSTLVV